jgi:hypothetical protein
MHFIRTCLFILLQILFFYNGFLQAQWVKTNGLDSGFVRSFAFSGINSFAGTYKGVYLSTNNGLNWTQMNNGPGGNYVWPLTVNGANIFVGTDSGIYR